MSRFVEMVLECIQSPEFKRDLKKATQIDLKRVEQNQEAYNRVKERFSDLPYPDHTI